MNEIFNPSLLISLGPSAGRSMEYARKQLAYLPKHFTNLIGFYNVDSNEDSNVDSNEDISLDKFSEEVQEIIDSQLLAAKHLNKLVDMGYKVRSENISTVKINIYLFWDVYDTTNSASDIIKKLLTLNYGNSNKDEHSGVTLFIISIMEKEWSQDEDTSIEAVNILKQAIEYLSLKDNMMRIDSKVYILHCISNDGTRIPKAELEHICATIAYLNLLPSEDPPLSHFNHRLLMNEGAYKVGTLGIASITVQKDKLLEEFSSYMAMDILKHLCEYETLNDYPKYLSFELLSYENQQNAITRGMKIAESHVYPIDITQKLHIEMFAERAAFLKAFLTWQEHLKMQTLMENKQRIDEEIELHRVEIIKNIHKDLSETISRYSFKEGIKYLEKLEIEVKELEHNYKNNSAGEIPDLNIELEKRVKDYPNAIGFSVKALILTTFLLYAMNNLIFPLLNGGFKAVFIFTFIIIFIILVSIITFMDYKACIKKFSSFINKYKEEILEQSSKGIECYIDEKLTEMHKEIINYATNKREILIKYIANSKNILESITPIEADDNLGDLITNLLDFQDRQRYYREKAPKGANMYLGFLREAPDYEEFQKQTFTDKLLEFTTKVSKTYLNEDFYDYLVFKFKEDVEEEILEWIDKGAVKSKYLLQFKNEDALEEHSFLITSPDIFKVSKDMISNKLPKFNISIVSDRDKYANNISLIRLCLGINLDDIFSTKSQARRDKDA